MMQTSAQSGKVMGMSSYSARSEVSASLLALRILAYDHCITSSNVFVPP